LKENAWYTKVYETLTTIANLLKIAISGVNLADQKTILIIDEVDVFFD
jgi:hypothetical protein